MANFTTGNNTYCFRIGPTFLDTNETQDIKTKKQNKTKKTIREATIFCATFFNRKKLMEDTAVIQVVYFNALINFEDYQL